MSLLELASRLAESVFNAAARSAHADAFQNACEAITTFVVDGYKAGELSLLEVADHVARYEVIMNWMSSQVAAGKMSLIEVARITVDYIAYFSG